MADSKQESPSPGSRCAKHVAHLCREVFRHHIFLQALPLALSLQVQLARRGTTPAVTLTGALLPRFAQPLLPAPSPTLKFAFQSSHHLLASVLGCRLLACNLACNLACWRDLLQKPIVHIILHVLGCWRPRLALTSGGGKRRFRRAPRCMCPIRAISS